MESLPLPGSGRTAERFRALWEGCRADVSAGRLAEAHHDADAIFAEIGGGRRVRADELWGVWAAEPPHPFVEAVPHDRAWLLTGTKPWCSGTGRCTHALLTARVDGSPRLFAVDLRREGVRFTTGAWVNAGMADTATGEVHFDSVPAETVDGPRDYLDRPGFWHGGVGVAACWLGGAAGLLDAVRKAARADRPHALAHDAAVARRIADVTVYTRQCHAERDEAWLGELLP